MTPALTILIFGALAPWGMLFARHLGRKYRIMLHDSVIGGEFSESIGDALRHSGAEAEIATCTGNIEDVDMPQHLLKACRDRFGDPDGVLYIAAADTPPPAYAIYGETAQDAIGESALLPQERLLAAYAENGAPHDKTVISINTARNATELTAAMPWQAARIRRIAPGLRFNVIGAAPERASTCAQAAADAADFIFVTPSIDGAALMLDAAMAHSPPISSLRPNTSTRIILINRLKLHLRIGICDWERLRRQPILVSARLTVNEGTEPGFLCYATLAERLRAIAGEAPIDLIEDLAERIISLCFEDMRVSHVHLTITKPLALDDADAAGITLIRSRTG